MKVTSKIALVIAALAFGAAPAVAIANGPGKSSGAPGHNKTTPTPTTTSSSAEAYGRLCLAAGASKKHVKGIKGTPFSQCVTGLAHAAKNPKETPNVACKSASKKHVSGSKGTPFSECVAATKSLRAGSH